MGYFIHNGKIQDTGTPIINPENRGLRYGDGVFETIKYAGKGLVLADGHFERFWKGMELLNFDIPRIWTASMFTNEMVRLAAKNSLTTARIRLTSFRGDGGLFDPQNNIPGYIMEAMPLPQSQGQLNDNGLRLCIFRDGIKSIDAFSNIKHNNMLPYFMGAAFAKANQCNDAIILNSKGKVCETTIANIFVVKGGIIYTPALTEGCIAGIMRYWLIEKIRELGFTVQEAEISETDVYAAEEVFLSNSIFNIRWVSDMPAKKFTNQLTVKISYLLQAGFPDILGSKRGY